ncbi:MAG: helix-turn-helix domain-containing protein [Ruminococcaceae bacterium]|nr:helix-turn-helix domain-containing protein [Oscillospiraceae bacterium]
MSDPVREKSPAAADDKPFFRRYDIRLSGSILITEFDSGFLSPSKIVLQQAHNHAAIELSAVSKGISTVEVMGTLFSCTSGSVLLIPSGIYHSNRPTDLPSERFCFRFYPKGQSSKGDLQHLGNFFRELNTPQEFAIPEILPILTKIREEFLQDAPGADEMISSLLQECFILLLRKVINEKAPESHPAMSRKRATLDAERVKSIERFFSLHYASAVTLKELAHALYLSPTQTNRILLAKYGQSFREKLRDTRLQQAQLLLRSTDRSVYEIASDVGYASVAGFFSAFQKAFGMPPAKYRKTKKQM